MQTMNRIYRYIALMVVTTTILSSCQKEVDEWNIDTKKTVTIALNVEASELTRALPNTMEKAINSLRIYAFYSSKRVGHIYREATVPGTPFYMDLELPESGTHNVNFYLIANEEEMASENGTVILTENMTEAQLAEIKFTGIAKGEALPMYDIKTEGINVDLLSSTSNTIVGHEGHAILNQTINFTLERPIAKLSVYAAKAEGASTNPLISKVELQAEGTRQYNYLFAKDRETLNAIPSRRNNRALLNTTVEISRGVESGSDAAKEVDNYNEVVANQYLSEVSCGASAWNIPSEYSNAAVLHVEYALGAGKTLQNAYVYLPEVKRNHHIKVCILFNAEGQIFVNYEVADWEDNEMRNYHFDYPTHSYLRESIPTTEDEIKSNPSREATMTEGNPFKGYFQMTQPANDAWTPTLLGFNGANSEIRVYEVTTNIEVTTFPIAASDKWYRIEVWPLTGKMETGEEVMLGISYTASGLTESEFLLINGSNLEYYWPYNGTSKQDAEYVIITMKN